MIASKRLKVHGLAFLAALAVSLLGAALRHVTGLELSFLIGWFACRAYLAVVEA